jgi:hypothetical protein
VFSKSKGSEKKDSPQFPVSDYDVEELVGGECGQARHHILLQGRMKEGGSAEERALRDGTLEMEDYTNIHTMRAGRRKHGYSF